MLNQTVLVGRVKESPIINKVENGVSNATLLIDVERNFRNANGDVDIDTFKITLWRGIAEECEVGSIVGVRGRLQAKNGSIEIIAEKLSFLSKE